MTVSLSSPLSIILFSHSLSLSFPCHYCHSLPLTSSLSFYLANLLSLSLSLPNRKFSDDPIQICGGRGNNDDSHHDSGSISGKSLSLFVDLRALCLLMLLPVCPVFFGEQRLSVLVSSQGHVFVGSTVFGFQPKNIWLPFR